MGKSGKPNANLPGGKAGKNGKNGEKAKKERKDPEDDDLYQTGGQYFGRQITATKEISPSIQSQQRRRQ